MSDTIVEEEDESRSKLQEVGGRKSARPVHVRRLALKELREILRDRRTTTTLVLMPLLVYPLLGLAFQKFLISSVRKVQATDRLVAVGNERDARLLDSIFQQSNSLFSPEEVPDAEVRDPLADAIGLASQESQMRLVVTDEEADEQQLREMIANRSIDAAVVFDMGREDRRPEILVLFDKQSLRGRDTRDEIFARVHAIQDEWVNRALPHVAMPVIPWVYKNSLVASTVQSFSIVTFLPLVLVLMTITGAVYPAIDLTAGERERGTMEILVAAPVSRLSLLLGKFLAVLAVAMLTAGVNMFGMLVTVYTLGLDGWLFGDAGLQLMVVVQIGMLLLVFAAFFSAVMLGLTSFARSFKEAQAYLIPLMLIALAPGILSLMPDLELNTTLAILPLVNIVLSGRDLLLGELNITMFAVTIVSTFLYGLLALSLAARVFGTDSILYGSDSSWADLFKRPEDQRLAPTMSSAMMCLAVLFPSFVVIGGLSARIGDSVSDKLLANAMVTVVLFVGIPWLFARIGNLSMRPTFSLGSAQALAFVGAALLGASTWVFAYEVEILTLSTERMEMLRELFESMKIDLASIPLAYKLLALAIVPAVCEEFFFRGYLLSALLRESRPWQAILGSALMFGLFHVMVRDVLLLERFLPSTMIGIVLGYVCVRSGSLIPGIVMHALHTGLLITISHFEKQIAEAGLGLEARAHLPGLWICIGLGVSVAGAAVMLFVSPQQSAVESTASNVDE